MPGISWGPEEKECEWAFAKEKLMPQGKLLPNGSKLRHKDYPDNLNHSFMVIDGRIIAISGKGVYLGSGRDAHAKLAEDEAGNLIALKIFTKDAYLDAVRKESQIAYDLGIAGQQITRTSTSKNFPIKHYIAYQYLGSGLSNYIRAKPLALDKCYELCIKISLALHEIHTGKKSKSKKSYEHNDIHFGNIVIDDQEEIHFIDYGKACETHRQIRDDIVNMLLIFFAPIKDRNHRHVNWIFCNWMGEYAIHYDKPIYSEKLQQYMGRKNTIYIYVEPSDQIESGFYPQIHYMVRDSESIFRNGVINLDSLKLAQLPHTKEDQDETYWQLSLSSEDLSQIEDKVLELAEQNNYIISGKNRNKVLFDLLKDPTAFYRTSEVPTALDIAETLTLCRLQLETHQWLFKKLTPDVRLEVIHILNSMSKKFFTFYEQLRALSSKDSDLNQFIKNYIVSHLILSPKEEREKLLDSLNLQITTLHENNIPFLRQCINDIIMDINHARESLKAESINTHHQPSIQPLSTRIRAKTEKMEISMFASLPSELKGHIFSFFAPHTLFSMACVNRYYANQMHPWHSWHTKNTGQPDQLNLKKELLPHYIQWLSHHFIPQVNSAIEAGNINKPMRFQSASKCPMLPDEDLLPLYAAIYLKSDVLVKKLIAAGVNLNCRDEMFAFANQEYKKEAENHEVPSFNQVSYKIENEKNKIYRLVDSYDILDNYFSPLHLAIATGSIEIVSLILKHMVADSQLIQIPSEIGLTPLAMAIKNGQMEIVNLLIRHGAWLTPEILTTRSDNLVHLASISGKPEILKLVLSTKGMQDAVALPNKAGITPLHYAAKIGNVENIALLLKHGAHKNVNHSYDMSLVGGVEIYWPEYYQHKYGFIETRYREIHLRTPIAITDNKEIKKLLLENGAGLDFETVALKQNPGLSLQECIEVELKALEASLNTRIDAMVEKADVIIGKEVMNAVMLFPQHLDKPLLDALGKTIPLLLPSEMAARVILLQLNRGVFSIAMNTSQTANALYNLCQAYNLTPSIKDFVVSLDSEVQIKYFIEKIVKLNFAKVLEEAPEFYEESLEINEEKKKCTMM